MWADHAVAKSIQVFQPHTNTYIGGENPLMWLTTFVSLYASSQMHFFFPPTFHYQHFLLLVYRDITKIFSLFLVYQLLLWFSFMDSLLFIPYVKNANIHFQA